MGKVWQLQEAKAKFSEVVKRAMNEGPQIVTLRGEPAVTISAISEPSEKSVEEEPAQYKTKKRKSLVELMRECPAPEVFDFIEEERKKDFWQGPPRPVDDEL